MLAIGDVLTDFGAHWVQAVIGEMDNVLSDCFDWGCAAPDVGDDERRSCFLALQI